ncbi:hypothetical protein QBC35DRAFT_455009 [Podospora australis]|uniref:Uncharacterized protein n=1 Tax=Podospora australis TaxID=1536484 RepID=A0AAN6WQU4_9PEZI|nr:hypothetical protein QBC35DRAFT_455009 [Podospora australis]
MPPIPLKAQVGIRDHWDKKDGDLQKTLSELQELLGHEVVANPEWHLIITELDFYPDKNNLIAVIAGCIQVWAKSMIELLDDPENEGWSDTLLTKCSSRLALFLDVASSDKAATAWSEQRKGFVISLPKKQIFQPAEFFPVFRGDLLACFEPTEAAPPKQLSERPKETSTDDWADVEVVVGSKGTKKTNVEFMPNADSLPRPDQLLLRPPYHLTLATAGSTIEIHCSHSPTLQFLSNYLKRWCRVNHNDTTNPPAVQVKLYQSAFGLGEMFDRLVLTTEHTRYNANDFRVTAPMVVALMEGVLGYELVSTQGVWSFRRHVEFKTL